MTIFFFLLLTVGQIGMAAVGTTLAYGLALIPFLQPLRRRMLGLAIGAACGGFVGPLGGFLGVCVVGLVFCHLLARMTDPVCRAVTEPAIGFFLASYPLGLVLGGVVGWLRGTRQVVSRPRLTGTKSEGIVE